MSDTVRYVETKCVGGKVDGQILFGTRSEKPKSLFGTRDEKRKNLFGTKWQLRKILFGSQRLKSPELLIRKTTATANSSRPISARYKSGKKTPTKTKASLEHRVIQCEQLVKKANLLSPNPIVRVGLPQNERFVHGCGQQTWRLLSSAIWLWW